MHILQDGNIVIKVKFVTILHVSCEKSINIICIVVVWCVITELKFVSACGHNILKLPEHGSENQLDKHVYMYILIKEYLDTGTYTLLSTARLII